MTQFLAPAFAVLFYFSGVLIGASEPNFSIGIRTPWTLSNETVWRKNPSAGRAIVFAPPAAVALLGVLWPPAAIWLMLIPVLCAAVGAVFYSYFGISPATKK